MAALVCVFAIVAGAQEKTAPEKTKVKGMIKARTGEMLVVQTEEGDKTVLLAENTRTKDDRGIFGVRKEDVGPTVLIPGLKLQVEGTVNEKGQILAKTITVDGDDIETSQMIAAGLHPTAEQVATNVDTLQAQQQGIAANKQSTTANKERIDAIDNNIKQTSAHIERFSKLDDYDVKRQATVKFRSGSKDIPDADKKQLQQLADSAKQSNGYLIEVVGYADATGNPAMNTKLSEERARNVVAYLTQICGVPVRRIVAPGAMGEYGPTATNETVAGRSENRRVEVKILQNKGMVASQ